MTYEITNISSSNTKFETGKKVGIYGGSFNPIHVGHFKTAEYLLDGGYLDEVRFLLNPCSPFKIRNYMPDAYFRSMAILHGINSLPEKYKMNMDLDTTEMLDSIQNHVCYTVNTLKRILYTDVQNKTFNEYFLIVGADVFNSIKRFKNWEWFVDEKLVKFIVLPRGGYEINENLREEFKELIIDVDYSKFEPIELSSTAVREWITNGNDAQLKNVLASGTHSYICSTGLYDYPNKNSENKLCPPVRNEIPNNAPSYIKTYTPLECKKMLKKLPYSRRSCYTINIDNAFEIVKTSTKNIGVCFNVYDYSKGGVVCDDWFLDISNIITFDDRILGYKKYFQCDCERFNTRMFITDNTTYYAIVDTGIKISCGSSKNQITAKNVLAFNHNSCEYLFKDCVIRSSVITKIEESGIRGVLYIELNDGSKVEFNLIKRVIIKITKELKYKYE